MAVIPEDSAAGLSHVINFGLSEISSPTDQQYKFEFSHAVDIFSWVIFNVLNNGLFFIIDNATVPLLTSGTVLPRSISEVIA